MYIYIYIYIYNVYIYRLLSVKYTRNDMKQCCNNKYQMKQSRMKVYSFHKHKHILHVFKYLKG